MKTRFIIFILCIVLAAFAISVGPSLYFYWQYQKVEKLLQNPSEIAKQEVMSITSKVGKLIQLPKGEDPTLATITDVEKLHDQPFFSKAKNGDKVLIYTQAKKVILYRPTDNKIVDVSFLNITPNNK